MARKIEVDLVANARPFNNTLDAAVGKVTGFSSRLKAMGGGSIGKGLAIGAGVASFNLLTQGISVAISKMDEMHEAFLADEASQTRLQNVIKNTVKDYDKATASAEAFAQAQLDLGFQDNDVRDSIGQLIGVTHDMAKAQELASLSMDIARNKNIDLAAATDAVTRAYNGQGRGLVALGIDTRNAANGTELLARAYKNVHGAALAYANTSAGRVAKANAKMDETFEKLGKAIDVVSQVAIPIMQTGLSALVDLAGAIIGAFVEAARILNENFGPALAAIGDLARAVASPLALLADIGANIIGAVAGNGGGGQQQGGVVNAGAPTGGIKVTKIGQFGGSFATGGVVPGSGPTLIMAHGGETVTPKGQQGQTIIVNIASFIGSDRDIDRFTDRIAFRLRATSLS